MSTISDSFCASRWCTDAAAVKPARAADEALTATGQQLVALDEERSPLVEHDLEGSEIHDRRIGLDLPEIRVDRGIQGQVRSQAVFEVSASAAAVLVIERVGGTHIRAIGGVRGDVRQQLEASSRWNPGNPLQPAEVRREARGGHGDESPLETLVLVRDVACELEPPGLHVRGVEAKLRKRDVHLGDPTLGVYASTRIPYRIVLRLAPGVLAVLRVVGVAAHAA